MLQFMEPSSKFQKNERLASSPVPIPPSPIPHLPLLPPTPWHSHTHFPPLFLLTDWVYFHCLGDLAYLEVTTLEGQVYYITATPTGFYLNRSSGQENFDPSPKKTHHQNRHLVGLLSQVSYDEISHESSIKFILVITWSFLLKIPQIQRISLAFEFSVPYGIPWFCACMRAYFSMQIHWIMHAATFMWNPVRNGKFERKWNPLCSKQYKLAGTVELLSYGIL